MVALDDSATLRATRLCVHQVVLERKKVKERFNEVDVSTIAQCHELLEAEITKIDTKLAALGFKRFETRP